MSRFDEQYKTYRDLIETGLRRYLAGEGIHESLCAAMSYSIHAGGKRLRPTLLLAANGLLDGDINEALPFACAIEMIHTYSLIHDDLPAMDDDDYRRGMPTCHKQFGEWLAILAGDGLLSYAFEIMLEEADKEPLKMPVRIRAAKAIAFGAGTHGMVSGQCADMANENEGSEKELIYIHSMKTGALLKASVEAGIVLCNPSEPELDAVRRYGDAIGMAFQITDDILDVTGDPNVMGKTTGLDEKNEKLTYPKIFGLERSKSLAEEKVNEAVASLVIFGDKSSFLTDLALSILNRPS
jgi:geranylgeranyl diphosphate synthase, type II